MERVGWKIVTQSDEITSILTDVSDLGGYMIGDYIIARIRGEKYGEDAVFVLPTKSDIYIIMRKLSPTLKIIGDIENGGVKVASSIESAKNAYFILDSRYYPLTTADKLILRRVDDKDVYYTTDGSDPSPIVNGIKAGRLTLTEEGCVKNRSNEISMNGKFILVRSDVRDCELMMRSIENST